MNTVEKIERILERIEKRLPEIDHTNLKVSKASVGWHLEHSLLIINSSLKGLTTTDPSAYQPVFSIKKWLFLTFEYVPKGKIVAPKPFIPVEIPTQESIIQLMSKARHQLNQIAHLSKNAYIAHPFLGHLNKSKTLKFLKIHTNHHLKIVHDILKN